MCVKAVYDIEKLRQLRCLLRQVGRASATDDADVDIILMCSQLTDRIHLSTFCRDLYLRRITSRKYTGHLTVRIVPNRSFHTTPDISISNNSNSYFIHYFSDSFRQYKTIALIQVHKCNFLAIHYTCFRNTYYVPGTPSMIPQTSVSCKLYLFRESTRYYKLLSKVF